MTLSAVESELKRSTVAIVGLGLMGGSLALALKARSAVARIFGIDRNHATLESALKAGAIDRAGDDLSIASEANVLVVATPVRTIIRLVPRLGEMAADGALLLDLGSTKRDIVRCMDELPPRVSAVGGHPLCGREKSGYAAARPDLFDGSLFVLTPTSRSTAPAMSTATALARAVGARSVVMDAVRHDRIVAATSHLPFMVASNLVRTLDERARLDAQFWDLAASGFLDTTRVASSSVEMMLDILLTNGENVSDLMRDYSRRFAELADAVYDGDEAALRAILESAAFRRTALEPPRPL